MNEATEAMELSSKYVIQGEQTSNKAFEELNKILDSSKASSTKAKIIVKETTRQVENISELGEVVKTINNTMKTVQVLTQEQKESAPEVLKSTADMRNKVEQLKSSSMLQSNNTKKLASALSDYSQLISKTLNATIQYAEDNKSSNKVMREIKDTLSNNMQSAKRMSRASAAITEIVDNINKETSKYKVDEKDDAS